jgi:HEAT repeats
MKRVHAAVLTAALAGVVPAAAQQPPAPAPADVITLSGQDGKPSRQCRVLRSYKHPAGGTALEVRDEATGEVMTIIENADPEKVKATLKPETVTQVPVGGDPILQPKAYAGARVQQKFGSDVMPAPMPVAQPAPAPQPAPRRFLGWLRNDPKPAPGPQSKAVRQGPTEVVAQYHPDPVIRLIGCMSDDLLPSMREVSAEALIRDGKGRPEVTEALVRSAKTDPAPSVRACCCRCLGEMHDRSPETLAVLKDLSGDTEPSVRTAAAAALALVGQP